MLVNYICVIFFCFQQNKECAKMKNELEVKDKDFLLLQHVCVTDSAQNITLLPYFSYNPSNIISLIILSLFKTPFNAAFNC